MIGQACWKNASLNELGLARVADVLLFLIVFFCLVFSFFFFFLFGVVFVDVFSGVPH